MANTNWEKVPKKQKGNDGWATISTGTFAPQWKPNRAKEDVIFIPQAVRIIPKSRKMDNEGVAVDCKLVGGASESFFMKDVKKGVANGEKFSMALSHQLQGEDKIAIHELPTKKGKQGTARLSPLSLYCLAHGEPIRVVYDGQVKSGARKVNLFSIMVKYAVLEAIAAQNSKSKK